MPPAWNGAAGGGSAGIGDFARERSLAAAPRGADGREPPRVDGYGPYQNPLVEYLTGVVFALPGGDAERARVALAAARQAEPYNDHLAALQQYAEDAAAGRPVPPMTHVVYEDGLAPFRDQFKLDVPLSLYANSLDSDLSRFGVPGIALPTLSYATPAARDVLVRVGGETYATERVSAVDAIVRAEFDEDYGRVALRAFTAAVAKAAAAYAANKVADEQAREIGGLGGLLTSVGSRIGTGVYQYATNQADQRTWRTLPAEVQIAGFPTPADGRVTIESGGRSYEVEADPTALATFVFVRRPTRAAPPAVRYVNVR